VKIKKATAMCAVLSGIMFGGAVTVSTPASASSKDQVTIYLTRHGETTGNVMQRVQGSSDFPLTKNGIEVANDLGYGLKGIKFKHAYTGNLTRQEVTAQHVLKYSNKREPRSLPRLSCEKAVMAVSKVTALLRTTKRSPTYMATKMARSSNRPRGRTIGTSYRMPTTSLMRKTRRIPTWLKAIVPKVPSRFKSA
jgi:Fructose-2,6-bisphosphatase